MKYQTIKNIISLGFLLALAVFSVKLQGQVTASFTADATTGCVPKLIKFTDNSTGNITAWQWSFGNSATSTLQNPAIIYTTPGVYTVSLTVSGPGGTNTTTKTAYITIFDVPQADFTINTPVGCQHSPFTFTNTSTTRTGGGAITTYFWDFGDGNSNATKDPLHNYQIAGNMTVRLRITDANGCEAFKEKPSSVLVNPTPVVGFVADKPASCITPSAVNFTNQTTGSNIAYNWDLGNGTKTTATDPSTTYNSAGSYNVKLLAVNTVTGCKDSLTKNNFISAGNNVVDFSPSQAQGCKNNPLGFTITGSGTPQSVLWDFGDGNASNASPATNTYTAAGTYNVKLIVTFAGGCADTVKKLLVVDDVPTPAYTMNPRRNCTLPFNVTFTNNLAGNGSFWDFGDGDTSSQRNIIHTYKAYGPFIINFTTITAGGCKATQTDTINFKPEILVMPTPRQVCADSATVGFSFTADPIGVTSVLWDFADGTTSTQARPSHFFNQGQYIVKLTVTYGNGCTATGQDTVSVFSKPIPNFVVDKQNECVKKNLTFTNLSQNFTAFEWDFGDGITDSINVNPKHQYRNWPKILELPDSFDIKLTLWNGTCQKDTTITSYININPPLAWMETDNIEGLYCDTPAIVRFKDVSRYKNQRDSVVRLWSFNDPYAFKINNQQCTTDTKKGLNAGKNCNFSADSLPTHTYKTVGDYDAKLWLFSLRTGCKDSIINTIRVRTKFVANYKLSDTTGCAPLTVNFTDTTKRSVSWFWNFGDPITDGDTDIIKQPLYTYNIPGNYTANLTATDKDGCVASPSKIIYVKGPRANFKTNGKVCPPDSVSFVDISTKIDSLSTWVWKFGDKANAPNDTSRLRHPKYKFSQLGTYLVTLTVTDNIGCSHSLTRIIEYAPPKPVFVTVPALLCAGNTVNFQNYTTGGFANKYHWRFGDGDTSNLINPSHLYADTGSYDVFLKVSRNDGCQDSLTMPKAVTVVKPEFDFTVNKSKGLCPPFTVEFTLNQTSDVEEYYWDFGDSSNSSIQNPIHTYNIPGKYTVSLKAKSKGGCYDSILKVDYITVGGPVGTFSFNPKNGCKPLHVDLQASGVNSAVLYTWDYGDGNLDYLTTDTAHHIYRTNGIFRPKLILTDSNNCSLTYFNSDSISIINGAAVNFTASNIALCAGGTVTFTDNSTPAGAITQRNWFVQNALEASGTTFNRLFPDTGKYDVKLSINDTLGCQTDTSLTVSIKAQPVITISPDTSICFGNSTPLTVSGGISYKWTPSASLNNDTLASPTAQPLTTTTYTVLAKGGAGCPDINKNVKVTIMPLPSIDAGFNKTLCAGDSVTLTATGAVKYTWEYSPYISDTSLVSPRVYPPSTMYFKVFGTDGNGCTYYDSVQVESVIAPEPLIDGPPKVCYGSTTTLTANGGDSFLWSTNETTQSISVEMYKNESFWVKSSLKGCPGGEDTIDIEVDNSVFDADFTLLKDTFYSGELIGLINNSFGAINYLWNSNGKTYTDSLPNIAYRKEGEYTLTLTAQSATGCKDSASKQVIVVPDFIYFPNAFTPNGDYLNQLYQYFAPYELAQMEFKIYDRWGEVVFATQNQYQYWDGSFMGKPVADGVFVYTFFGHKPSGEIVTAKGTITLIR
jgi:gliding motility-associated-like protein